jgi:hypothetical protein
VIGLPALRPAAAILGLAAAASLGAQTFRVGPTVHVSRAGAERAHEEVILGAHPTDPRRLLGCGDTSGLASDADGVFHALWADQRSGIGQVYTATIAVDAPADRGAR